MAAFGLRRYPQSTCGHSSSHVTLPCVARSMVGQYFSGSVRLPENHSLTVAGWTFSSAATATVPPMSSRARSKGVCFGMRHGKAMPNFGSIGIP